MLFYRNRSTLMPSRAAIVALALGMAGTLDAASSPADTAATAAPDSTSESASLDEVIVTGSRQKDIKASDSPAPIQVVSAEALKTAGASDLMGALAQIVPSLQMQAFGFDQAGQTLLAKLRGLSPNDVLVLINGKRRHTTANLQVDPGSPYQGGASVDLKF
jgi:iron complex outermembrane recepter protein